MELSLYGSQINLATREKTTPTNSPAGGGAGPYRPGSAFNSSRPFPAHIRRPLSADSQIRRKSSLGPPSGFLSKRSTSSSSLLKSLLAEPISRYWGSKTLTASAPSYATGGSGGYHSSSKQMSKVKSKKRSSVAKKKVLDCSSEEDSSMDEDTQESNNETELENIWSGDGLKIAPGIDRKPPLPRLVGRKTYPKKPVSNVPKLEKKLDLPGRVSFSSNDPYEIDYSDYENDLAMQKPRRMESTYDEAKFQEPLMDSLPKARSNPAKFEDDLTSSGYETREEKAEKMVKFDSTPDSFFDEEDSNKIIEDYKKEIEDINRRRDMELKLVHSEGGKQYDPKQFTTVEIVETFVEETYKFASCTSTVEDTDNESEKPCGSVSGPKKDVINEYYECINEIINQQGDKKHRKEGKEDVLMLNLNNESKPAPGDKNFQSNQSSTKSVLLMDKNKLEGNSNQVIKNYFKAKEQNFNETKCNKSNQKNNNLVGRKNGKALEKPKSADAHKSILRNSKKNNVGSKFSASLCRQDSNISEFQMEKVVSWMSCNEDTFPKPYESHADAGGMLSLVEPKCRAVTPSDLNKTDDESNFNFDHGRVETADSEQTNFDVESMASEIINKPNSDFQALKNEVEFRLSNILDSRDSPDSSGQFQPVDRDKDKVKDLFSYLDQVEMKCEKSLKMGAPSESDRSEMDFAAEPDYMETVPKLSDLLEIPIHQLARRVIKLSLRANELSNAMHLSKDHLSNVKADKMKAVRAEKVVFQNKLKEQKKHYEDIIGRHQEFIDQLIKDKSGLCDKVTQLTRRIESQNQSWEHRLKTELDKAKDTALAGEKIRREKWVRENTKKIKELTVKGLELEINKMTATHQKEIAELKRQHKDEMLVAISELKLQYEQKEADIRQNLLKDRESFIEKERQALLERFDKQVCEERVIFEQQRQHLLNEFEIEKERNLKELKNRNQYFETQIQQLKKENSNNLEFSRNEYVQMLKDRENKHKEDLAKLQNQLEADFAIWKKKHEETAKMTMEERENNLRQQMRVERDQQIDRIVAKVDAETQKYQQDFDAKMGRLKEKHQVEMREQEASEALLKQKYQDTRAKLAETEAATQNMKASMKQLELQLNHSKKLCEDLLREKETMKDEARREVQKDLSNMQKERDREIERIYCRVQQAIDKKDSTIGNLQKEVAALKERCLKQDAVIRQQRIDYCIK
ncbi:centrosomal protein of 131 kDa isoform X2 [Toxorhynchites rutilus septentrionalis]|uniref:centrosomal protein of 131 kDa isoform X2 n=1 Tax=Toxorhynchites rutilus septentrionalis TaxID=329112 RepID=UPI0024788A0A|nr:centrosomal protein of 131 kDa isoform X2 [Toxorhynchites rutilus septentrionalis]